METLKDVQLRSRLPSQPITSTAHNTGRDSGDVDHLTVASSASEKVDEPSPRTSYIVAKNFGDLPGEIRNFIYQVVSEDIKISVRQVAGKGSLWMYEIFYPDSAIPYANSRPFAWLGVNHQVQAEFSHILPFSKPNINSGGRFGSIVLQSTILSNINTRQHDPVQAVANYVHVETDVIDICFAFWFPGCMTLTDNCHELIKGTIHNLFNTKARFSVLQFLIAVDQVVTLELDLEEWDKPICEYMRMVQFELVLKLHEEGTWKISDDEFRKPVRLFW